ncbi:GHKL domain-containing protein [Clostridiaceae bacterium 35-E11]
MNIRGKAYILVGLVLMQSVLTMSVVNVTYMNKLYAIGLSYKYSYPLIIIVNLLGLSSILCIYYILKVIQTEKEALMKLNHSKEVIDALQGQKHDFNNHLNLLSAMMQVGKYDKALEYIFTLSQQVDSAFSVSKIKHIEIGATLCRKCAIAESKGITVEMEIETALDNLKMSPMDLCKIIFNLLDNAIYELEACDAKEKILTIDIQEYEDTYCIAIGNSFPVLSPSEYDRIFEPGYSTKQGDDHGYGLHIIKKILAKNKGEITVESYEGVGTIFTVFLPQQKKPYEAL